MKTTFLLALLCLFTTYNFGQIAVPAPSPSATIIQKIGLGEVEISYSRPSTNGRAIFGASALVRYGEFWRTGANAATNIKITQDFIINGQALPKGQYALLTKPGSKTWQIYLYPYQKQPWNKFVETTPAAVLEVDASGRKDFRESLLIYFDDLELDKATLIIEWADQAIDIPFEIPSHKQMMNRISRVMSGPSSFDYFNAASYLYQSDTDLPLALSYIQKATRGKNPQFFFYRIEATILAKLGRHKEAIAAAQQSKTLAEEVGNSDAIILNERSIAAWQKLLDKK